MALNRQPFAEAISFASQEQAFEASILTHATFQMT